jgi:hypothetical protein
MSSRSRLVLFFFLIFSSVACSSGSDTVLALNFSSGPNVTNVTRIEVTATRSNGSPYSGSFTAQSPDAGPMTAFFERVTLPDWEGQIHVAAEGFAADQKLKGSASSDVHIEKGTAFAVYLKLTDPDFVPPPDAGPDAGPDAPAEADAAAD